jgi:hypothetical protein
MVIHTAALTVEEAEVVLGLAITVQSILLA